MTNLTNLLQGRDISERRGEIVDYIHHNQDEFAQVLEAAFDNRDEIRNSILDLVDSLSNPLIIQVIEKAIKNDDDGIKIRGLQAAYRTRIDSLNEFVFNILADTNEVFDARKWALHILGSTDPDCYSQYIMQIARNRVEKIPLRKEAIYALTKIVNDKTLGTICTLLGDSDAEIRQSGAWALSNIGFPESIPCLLAALDDDDELVRDWAIRGLRDMDDARALQGLADAVHVAPPEEQVRMIRLIVEKRSEIILRTITELLTTPDIDVRRTAAWAMGVSPYPPAVPSLKELLDDPDEEVRDYARIALIRSGGLDPTDLKL